MDTSSRLLKRQAYIQIYRQTQAFQFFEERLSEDTSLEMMMIKGGSFFMGSPKDEVGRRNNEEPQHHVTIPQFFMSKYPVTQIQWKVVSNLEPVKRQLNSDPSHFKGNYRPVEQVSWYDAIEFCTRLSQLTGRAYRLPSEAEWEYACRAGTKTPFHFGITLSTDCANYNGSSEKYGAYGPGVRGEHRGETTPIDFFSVCNQYGLFDMHGNVLEWCQDVWHENYKDAPQDGSAWIDGGNPRYNIRRGGSWRTNPSTCRSAYRDWGIPDLKDNFLGFRVCCSAARHW